MTESIFGILLVIAIIVHVIIAVYYCAGVDDRDNNKIALSLHAFLLFWLGAILGFLVGGAQC